MVDALDQQILVEVASGSLPSRAALARHLGVVRSTVALHVDRLLSSGHLAEGRGLAAGRGRPSSALRLGPRIGVGLAILFRDQSASLAVTDGYGAVLESASTDVDEASGPGVALPAAERLARRLLDKHGLTVDDVHVVVSAVPAPIDSIEGVPSHRGFMPLWVRWPLRERLAKMFGAIAILDNDANLMALGAAASAAASSLPLLYLHLSLGVGAGMVSADGTIYRGADGAAGEIGHIRLAGSRVVQCACGRSGCIGAAIGLEQVLQNAGVRYPGGSVSEAVQHLRNTDALSSPAAMSALRSAGDDAGMLTAALVDALNPRTVVIGGEVVNLSDQVIATIRSRVYTEALPGATNRLTILPAPNSESLALLGAAQTSARSLLGLAQV